MAKSKDRGKAGKLPKRIGGVKLPKKLRRAAADLLRVAGSPAGQELIATALTVAAASLRAQAGRRRAAPVPPLAPHVPPPPRPANSRDPHEIGAEFGRIAEAALSGLFGKKS